MYYLILNYLFKNSVYCKGEVTLLAPSVLQTVKCFLVNLVQLCGNETIQSLNKCARHLNEWDEVYSCHEDFCNTFSSLRICFKQDDLEDNLITEVFHTRNTTEV